MGIEAESSDTDNWPTSQVSESEGFRGFDDCEVSVSAPGSNDASVIKQQKESTDNRKRSIFYCEQCKLSFRKRDYYDRHQFVHTGVREYRCTEPGCSKEYTNRTHLNRHIRSNHKEKPLFSGNVFHCKHPGCEKSFQTDQSVRRHYELKHVLGKSWSCQECGEQFWRKLQLKQHSFKHTGQYPHHCDICEKGFVNFNSFRNHRTTHALHKCEFCTDEFVRWTDLVAHRKLQHTSLYQCDICQGKFRSKRNLKTHMKIHQKNQEGTEKEVFQCSYEGCPKFYDYERNLLVHIKSKHEGTRKFVCPEADCGRSLSSKQQLEQHRKMHESAARSVPRMKLPGKPSAKRKDTGIPKLSTASRLANVRLEPRAERVLIEQSPEHRPQLELECSFPIDSASASESEVESCGKVGTIVEGQLARIQEQIKLLQEQTDKR